MDFMMFERLYYDQRSYHYPQPLTGGLGYVSHLNGPRRSNYRGPVTQIHSGNATRNSRSQGPSGQLRRNSAFSRLNFQIEDETALIVGPFILSNPRSSSSIVDETILLNGFGSVVDVESSAVTQEDKRALSEKIWRHLSTRASGDDSGQDLGFCVVCQSEFCDSEKLGKLECGHEYHADCIHKWLLQKNVCPVCKRTAISELGR